MTSEINQGIIYITKNNFKLELKLNKDEEDEPLIEPEFDKVFELFD